MTGGVPSIVRRTPPAQSIWARSWTQDGTISSFMEWNLLRSPMALSPWLSAALFLGAVGRGAQEPLQAGGAARPATSAHPEGGAGPCTKCLKRFREFHEFKIFSGESWRIVCSTSGTVCFKPHTYRIYLIFSAKWSAVLQKPQTTYNHNHHRIITKYESNHFGSFWVPHGGFIRKGGLG